MGRGSTAAVLGASVFILLLAFVSAELTSVGNLHYSDSTEGCDFATESCAPLSDVWGSVVDDTHYAYVGVANGVSIVNVEDPKDMVEVDRVPGCITEWRDMKVYENALYVVNDYTQLCNCTQQPCQQMLEVSYGDTTTQYRAEGGSALVPLSSYPEGVSGILVYSEPNADGCSPFSEDLTGFVALIDRGNCMFSEKAIHAQEAGAVAIVIVNERQDVIYPSMAGESDGVEIPGLLIGSDDGGDLKEYIMMGNVTATLDATNKQDSDLYSAPTGWVIIDVTNPEQVTSTSSTEFFNFAHNILVDPDRPFAYTCGQDNLEGGIVVYDISDPFEPQQIAVFDRYYIHDIEVVYREEEGYVLYAAGIYDSLVFILDVNDPAANDLNDSILQQFETIDMPHNTAQTEDGVYLYVSHEADAHPVTLWNVADFDNIFPVGEMSVHAERNTIPHNVFVDGTLLWMSYYSEGVVTFDISEDPANPVLIGHYDTSPYDTGFHGVWGIYPFVQGQANVTYASDIESGLWFLELTDYNPIIEVNITAFGRSNNRIVGGDQGPSADSSAVFHPPSFYTTGENDTVIEITDTTGDGIISSSMLLWAAAGVGVLILLVSIIVFIVVLVQRLRGGSGSIDDDEDEGDYDMDRIEDFAYDDEDEDDII